jgi:type II secretory pathway component GspD/PulD (secretin)
VVVIVVTVLPSLLGELPLVGWFFGNRSDRIKRTELVMLMTPHLMSGEEFITPSATARVEWPGGAGAQKKAVSAQGARDVLKTREL